LLVLVPKEWRDILAGHTLWALFLLLSALVGYSYTQAISLYGEASKLAQQLPEVARSLSPLDGVFVPTFGALYLANTFLFPFVAIRTVAREKQTGSLKLLLQLPCSLTTVVTAKLFVLLAVWLIAAVSCLSAVALWSLSGGHVGWAEVANLLLGHLLYAAVVVGIALLAAALAESSATAAILTLAATLAFWVLDFAAAGEGGLLKNLSNLSLTTLLRGFEQGVFSSTAALGALIASALLISLAGIWVDLRITLARKLVTSSLAVVLAVGLAAGAAIRPVYVDTTQDARLPMRQPSQASTSPCRCWSGLHPRIPVTSTLSARSCPSCDARFAISSLLRNPKPDLAFLRTQTATGWSFISMTASKLRAGPPVRARCCP